MAGALARELNRILPHKVVEYSPETVIPVMTYPKDRRQGIWRGGVLQIWTTRACDLACYGCTQGSNLKGPYSRITVEQFEQAVLSLDGYFGVIGLFGGNPPLHPDFPQLCEILARHVPFEQRGIWCNHPRGHGRLMSKIFNPDVSNLNVHMVQEAYDELYRDWPECRHRLKGLHEDSLHRPPLLAIRDYIHDESEMWGRISRCKINREWSAMMYAFRGQLRASFCEEAAAQAILHEHDSEWPDTGLEVSPGWWRQSWEAYEAQVRFHCPRCGMALESAPLLAATGPEERVSPTHANVCHPKDSQRPVQLVQILGPNAQHSTTHYLSGEI